MHQQQFQFQGMRTASPRQTFQRPVHQQQQLQFQAPPQQFTKPVVDVAKDFEKLQNDQSRLASLHTKLHKEAEKIRNWKSEKEMELKHKDRSLHEANGAIENLRKSIIEMQFQNEEYSTKLQEKEIEKAETEQKLHTVREMANVLRDQMVQLEERVQQGEKDKVDVIETNQKMLNDHQKLVLKFQELDISQAAMVEKNSSQLKVLRDEHEAQKNELQSNIRHLENQVINLMQTKTSQEKAINDYKTKQSGNEEKIKNMSNDLEENKEKLEAAEQVMFCQDQKLCSLNKDYEELTEQSNQCKTSLEEYEKKSKHLEELCEKHRTKAEEVQTICTNEINSLRGDIEKLKSVIDEKQTHLDSLRVEKIEFEEMVSSLQQQISIDKGEIHELKTELASANKMVAAYESKEKQLVEQLDHTSIEIQNAQEQITKLNSANQETLEKLNNATVDLSNLETEKTSLLQSIEKANDQLNGFEGSDNEKNSLIEKLKGDLLVMEKELSSRDERYQNLERQMNVGSMELKKVEDELKHLQATILKMNEEEEKNQSVIKEQNKALEGAGKEIETLQATLQSQKEELKKKSAEEQEQAEQMKNELANKEKKAEDLGNKTKTMKQEMSEKTKQLKNVEKENKSLKTQLKNKTDKIDKTEQEIEQYKSTSTDLQNQVAENERLLSECKTSLKTVQDNFDVEQKEFCSTLEQYKQENDKIVQDHVNENSQLKKQIAELNEKLSSEMETFRDELDRRQQTVDVQTKRVEELQTGLVDKDAQEVKIKELQDSLESMKSSLICQEEKSKETQKELDETLEKLEKQRQEKEKLLQQQNNLIRGNQQDSVVPETPLGLTPKTPIGQAPKTPNMRFSQKREKRVLFAGAVDDESMETDEFEEAPKSILKTPTIPTQRLKNIRYSPKASSFEVKEQKTPRTPTMRMGRTPNNKNQDILSLVSAHKEAVVRNEEKPAQSPSIFKLSSNKKQTIRQSTNGKNKMKKLQPKKFGKTDEDFSWFESDKNFAFTD